MSATLILGDCLEKMKSLPDKSVDCFICDLPYGQLTKGYDRESHNENIRRKLKTQTESCCAWDVKIDLAEFWQQVERLARTDDTPVIHFCNTKFGIDLINSKPDWFRYDLVWNKERGISFLLANKMPMKSHEMIYIFSKKGAYYNRIDEKTDKKQWVAGIGTGMKSKHYGIPNTAKELQKGDVNGMRCCLSVINMNNCKNDRVNKGHPTEKPQALYEWLLSRYCRPGGTVLDPTAGSFNSVIVARRLGLDAIGMEMDEGFYNKAVEKCLEEPEEL